MADNSMGIKHTVFHIHNTSNIIVGKQVYVRIRMEYLMFACIIHGHNILYTLYVGRDCFDNSMKAGN